MNFGFTLLSIGALVLMMIAVINASRLIVASDTQSIDSERSNAAVALGEAMMGEIRTKKFDHRAVIHDSAYMPSSFTLPLGPEVGPERDSCTVTDSSNYRSLRWYNDIDDYKNYKRFVRMPDGMEYEISVQVFYVRNDFSSESASQTYLKKVIVAVKNLATSSTIKFSAIHTL